MIELYLLLIFMIMGAVIAVEIRSLLSAVVSVGVVGFALCIIFFMLRAPDVAITQLIVEVLVLVLMVRATGVKRDLTEFGGSLRENLSFGVLLAFIITFSVFSIYALSSLPEFGKPLMTVSKIYLEKGLASTGAANIVSAVLLDFRGYDTLGEVTILFTAIVGALAVLRKKGRKKIEERDEFNS